MAKPVAASMISAKASHFYFDSILTSEIAKKNSKLILRKLFRVHTGTLTDDQEICYDDDYKSCPLIQIRSLADYHPGGGPQSLCLSLYPVTTAT
jgi:hypothetical protein